MQYYTTPRTTEATILVTECDTLPGFYAARQCISSRKWSEVVCAVEDKNNELAKMLQKEGGTLVDWDWSSTNQMEEVLEEADALLLAPPRDFEAVQQVKSLMRALKNVHSPVLNGTRGGHSQKGIKAMALLSCITAEFGEEEDENNNNNPFRRNPRRRGGHSGSNKIPDLYCEIETTVREYCSSVPILRVGFPMQAFFYLSEVIQNKGVLPLAAGNGEFAPVDFKDAAIAANNILLDMYEHHTGGGRNINNNNNNNITMSFLKGCYIADASSCAGPYRAPHSGHPHHGKVYVLTGSRLVTANQLAKIASQALDAPIQYDEVDTKQLKQILSQSGELSSFDIEDFLTAMCFVKQNKLDIVSRDLQKLIGKTPSDVAGFFRDNARQFKPKRRFAPRYYDSECYDNSCYSYGVKKSCYDAGCYAKYGCKKCCY